MSSFIDLLLCICHMIYLKRKRSNLLIQKMKYCFKMFLLFAQLLFQGPDFSTLSCTIEKNFELIFAGFDTLWHLLSVYFTPLLLLGTLLQEGTCGIRENAIFQNPCPQQRDQRDKGCWLYLSQIHQIHKYVDSRKPHGTFIQTKTVLVWANKFPWSISSQAIRRLPWHQHQVIFI